ncbi:MAG: methyl-accepting chemotaxis protein [Pedobacter sp.]
MEMINNMKIVTKVMLIGTVMTVLLVACTARYFMADTRNAKLFKQFRDVQVATTMQLGSIYAQGLQTEQALRNIVINPQDEKATANFNKALEVFDQLYTKAVETSKGTEIAAKLEQTRPLWDQGLELKRQIIELTKQGSLAEAGEVLVKQETPKWRSFKELILKMQEESSIKMHEQSLAIDHIRESTFMFNMSALAITLFVTAVLLLLLAKDLKKRLTYFSERLKEITTGEWDLTKHIEMDSKDELGELANYFNQAWVKLDKLIAHIVESSTLVGTYSGQLLIESSRIVKNSRQIAEQSTAVATASEEMSATSNDIARNCAMAADNSQEASNVASGGQCVVQKTIDRMSIIKTEVEKSSQVIERLGASSEKIGAIANTIQDIADQTNLLALNAAIEAARAGEQGRGFAVVADEVRALAERTARATREIGDMIKTIQTETTQAVGAMKRSAEQVTAGVEEANESGAALGAIIGQVGEVTMQVSQIATAAEEQTATTMEIVGSISNISETADKFDHTAVIVNEKINQLQTLSDDLKNSTSIFKTDVSKLLMLDTAKYDHVIFVNRIERCLDGKEQVQSNALPDHTCCRFGKWYFSNGKDLCGTSQTFKTINGPHEMIHRIAKEAVDLFNRGDSARAEEKLTEVENISFDIVNMLDRVKYECKGNGV